MKDKCMEGRQLKKTKTGTRKTSDDIDERDWGHYYGREKEVIRGLTGHRFLMSSV
jgi:hypothetical protein